MCPTTADIIVAHHKALVEDGKHTEAGIVVWAMRHFAKQKVPHTTTVRDYLEGLTLA